LFFKKILQHLVTSSNIVEMAGCEEARKLLFGFSDVTADESLLYTDWTPLNSPLPRREDEFCFDRGRHHRSWYKVYKRANGFDPDHNSNPVLTIKWAGKTRAECYQGDAKIGSLKHNIVAFMPSTFSFTGDCSLQGSVAIRWRWFPIRRQFKWAGTTYTWMMNKSGRSTLHKSNNDTGEAIAWYGDGHLTISDRDIPTPLAVVTCIVCIEYP